MSIRLICGWGINDSSYPVYITGKLNNKRKVIWVCPIYQDWKSMIERCYLEYSLNKRPTYKNTTICEEWKYFSNFRRWVLEEQPNNQWENCVLDKDLLGIGAGKYHPKYTVYINQKLNSFLTERNKSRGNTCIGVSLKSKYMRFQSYCRNPFTNKLEYLGYYSTELEAHKAWQAKKHEHACILADLQHDPRVADALRQRYAPDKDWTKA